MVDSAVVCAAVHAIYSVNGVYRDFLKRRVKKPLDEIWSFLLSTYVHKRFLKNVQVDFLL